MLPKIALFLPSLEGGGAERVFVQLANEFAAIGYRVHFVLTSASGPYMDEVSSPVRILDLGASSVSRALPALTRYLRSERPAVLLSALDHANIIAILANFASGNKSRCVVSVRLPPSAGYRVDSTGPRWLILLLSRWLFRFADQVVANARYVASDLSQSLRVPGHKLTVIYNPLDVQSIERSALAAIDHPWFAAGSAPVVLSVGSLFPRKDYETLIRAFSFVRSARDCRLVILGDGPERTRLETLARDLHVREDVHMPGFARNPFAWMARSRLFVSSSVTEGCPNALMQALACGTPVVSTDCWGGSAEVLESGRWGRLVPIRDPEALAGAIVAALDSSAHPDGRQRARDFAVNDIARQYLRVLLPGYSPSDTSRTS